jgi:hypothetical protein
MVYAAPYPGRGFRALGNEIIQRAVADDWTGALEKAHEHLLAVRVELERANEAANLLEHWAQTMTESRPDEEPLSIGEVSRLLGVSLDVIRNWERSGFLQVPRNSYNNYRLFGRRDRTRAYHPHVGARYSRMALRMFLELDAGTHRLKDHRHLARMRYFLCCGPMARPTRTGTGRPRVIRFVKKRLQRK